MSNKNAVPDAWDDDWQTAVDVCYAVHLPHSDSGQTDLKLEAGCKGSSTRARTETHQSATPSTALRAAKAVMGLR